MTLDDILGRCVVDDITGCWHFKGALSGGRYPRVWAPDLSKPGAPWAALPGKRVVWRLHSGKPIPQGHRVFSTCNNPACLNPQHIRCGHPSEWGRHLTASGHYKGVVKRQVSARKAGRHRSVLTPETYREIISSSLSGQAEAARLGVSKSTVSKARNGQIKCFNAVASPFAGLGARP